MSRFSKRFERDWSFYLDHREKFQFTGQLPREFEYDPSGPDAKQVWYDWESGHGLVATSEPDLLSEVHQTKSAINFHIKLWTEGFPEVMEPLDFYLDEFREPPKWIRKALVGSIRRRWGSNAHQWFNW